MDVGREGMLWGGADGKQEQENGPKNNSGAQGLEAGACLPAVPSTPV